MQLMTYWNENYIHKKEIHRLKNTRKLNGTGETHKGYHKGRNLTRAGWHEERNINNRDSQPHIFVLYFHKHWLLQMWEIDIQNGLIPTDCSYLYEDRI